ncbi:methyltransferase domain-containing protein [Gillisia marina]|uniref:methyltransferase domain-containing protein n=1 Tax=Gillisia marina TaxID=1167637 RepID=UPI00029B3CF0|nr:methyltransferase domain-containing protein [Gillisia marina]
MITSFFLTNNRLPFFDIAKKLLSQNDKILDIGPGNGNFASYINRKDTYFFEGNPISVNLLKKSYKNLYLGQLPLLPFQDNYFNLIHMSHVIEHLTPQVVYETLKEMDRCCINGGVIVISAPLLWEGFYDDLSHVKPYNPKIFFKYMCGIDMGNLSRDAISDKYSVEQISYRLREKKYFYGIKSSKNIILKMTYNIYDFLRKSGMKKTFKSGYTIVLRKASN